MMDPLWSVSSPPFKFRWDLLCVWLFSFHSGTPPPLDGWRQARGEDHDERRKQASIPNQKKKTQREREIERERHNSESDLCVLPVLVSLCVLRSLVCSSVFSVRDETNKASVRPPCGSQVSPTRRNRSRLKTPLRLSVGYFFIYWYESRPRKRHSKSTLCLEVYLTIWWGRLERHFGYTSLSHFDWLNVEREKLHLGECQNLHQEVSISTVVRRLLS